MTYVQNGDAKIYVESFGNKKDTAFILVIDAGAVSSLYPDDFCKKLAKTGLFVIRFDMRDYGRSTHFPQISPDLISSISPTNIPPELPYKMQDLVKEQLILKMTLLIQLMKNGMLILKLKKLDQKIFILLLTFCYGCV